MKKANILLFLFALLIGAPAVHAEAPQPWQINLPPPATSIAADLHHLLSGVNILIFAISIFVMVLLLICIFRFNEKANKIPSKTSHNTMLEVAWTVIPIIILVFLAFPSLRLLNEQLTIPESEVTIKAVGHQWYWSYEYPEAQIAFDSNLVPDNEIKEGQVRLLSVDNPLVVPVGTNIKVQVTATDVIHAWAVPAFGVKHDGVPGKINESWFNVDREGTFYGQCSELCGVGHAYMPIEIIVVSKEKYQEWLAETKKRLAAGLSVPHINDINKVAALSSQQLGQ